MATMRLKSALEDLHDTTVQAISGCLRRLEYFGRLRSKATHKKHKDAEYEHWGLARVYGDLPAMKALAQTHRTVVSNVLSTPIRTLLEEVETASVQTGIPASTYMNRLENPDLNLLPPAPGPGSTRHLNSVLQALSALTKSPRRYANRRAS